MPTHKYPDLDWDATRIKRLRKRLGMSPTEFAAAIYATRPSVDHWESGRVKPRDAYVVRALIELENALNAGIGMA